VALQVLEWASFGVGRLVFFDGGGADIEAEQRAREAVIEALPIEEQRRIYELFYQAGLRANNMRSGKIPRRC
jgi:hypothetical protein